MRVPVLASSLVSFSRVGSMEIGITDQLVRYSVGIEDCADLIADIEQSLAGI